jgi:hypothetical protein
LPKPESANATCQNKKGAEKVTEAPKITPKFRHVRLLLAREKGHPAGARDEGYDLLVPLDRDGHLDAGEWKQHQKACRVRHFRPALEDRIGLLRRKPGGQWYFDYAEGDNDNEIGFKLGAERFTVGEYVSVSSAGVMHTYQVAVVEKP